MTSCSRPTAPDTADGTVEPYVVAGDVYALAPQRGGWTWYTGSI